MTANEREQLCLSLLRFLTANTTRFGLSAALLHQMARVEGRTRLTQDDVEAALLYMAHPQRAYIEEVLPGLTRVTPTWRATPNGEDYFASH